MNYGIITYKRKGIINIGDDMQLLAIKQLYERIGVTYDSLVKIDFYDLPTYSGEEVLLPICFPFYGYNNFGNITCFSKKIKPIFLSLSLLYPKLNQDDYLYFFKNGPIGCRDEYTCSGLKKQGIDAYLNGCITLTIDCVNNKGLKDKIYCVDVYDELIDTIKNVYKEEIVFKSHILPNTNQDTIGIAEKLLEEYSQNAKIVITSRLHCALPCLAIGIPVIFLQKEYGNRFTWLEDIIHIYTQDEWDHIDWEPTSVDISFIKRNMINIAQKRLLGHDCLSDISCLESEYKKREKRYFSIQGMEMFKKWLRDNWKNDTKREFIIWGVIQYSTFLFDYINEHYKNATLTDVIDSYKRMSFLGHETKTIDEVERINDKYIFVCASAAARSAIEFIEEKQIDRKKVCIWSTKGIL